MKTTTLLLLMIACLNISGQNETPSFMGGMFYGGSYGTFTSHYGNESGFAGCLGGRLSYFVTPRICIGGRGNSIRFSYDDVSTFRLGSGGLTAGYRFSDGNLVIVTGIYGGGGRIHNSHAVQKTGGLYLMDNRSDSYLFVSPEFIAAYRLGEKISLAVIVGFPFFSKGTPGVSQRLDICGGILFFR